MESLENRLRKLEKRLGIETSDDSVYLRVDACIGLMEDCGSLRDCDYLDLVEVLLKRALKP